MNKEISGNGESKTVQAVERALAILETLAREGMPITITDLAEKVDLKLGTVHRLLNTLVVKGFVEQDEENSKYKLTLKLLEMGKSAIEYKDLQSVARPFLHELVDRCTETSNLAILDHSDVVYIDQVESTNLVMVRMFAKVGSRGPAHCTATGKILLAALGEEKLNNILSNMELTRFTNETITNTSVLLKELERVRQNEYALDLGERDEGVRCVAAPIRNHCGDVIAAVGVSGPSLRITNYYLNNELIDIVKNVADKISVKLGYQPKNY